MLKTVRQYGHIIFDVAIFSNSFNIFLEIKKNVKNESNTSARETPTIITFYSSVHCPYVI
jgi:hypothetical protein